MFCHVTCILFTLDGNATRGVSNIERTIERGRFWKIIPAEVVLLLSLYPSIRIFKAHMSLPRSPYYLTVKDPVPGTGSCETLVHGHI